MSDADLISGWTCDEKDRSGCRNPKGCHCREITALRHRRVWLILREPGCVPERKGPFPYRTIAKTLREFMTARPSALIDVLTVEGSPEIEDGTQVLEMSDGRSSSVARRHRETTRAAFAAQIR